jgi:hypothetical protein
MRVERRTQFPDIRRRKPLALSKYLLLMSPFSRREILIIK